MHATGRAGVTLYELARPSPVTGVRPPGRCVPLLPGSSSGKATSACPSPPVLSSAESTPTVAPITLPCSTSKGRLLGDREFPADRGGYRQLLHWLGRHGQVGVVGVEGTGSYGAGLTRYLLD
jgi:hypothetical protein